MRILSQAEQELIAEIIEKVESWKLFSNYRRDVWPERTTVELDLKDALLAVDNCLAVNEPHHKAAWRFQPIVEHLRHAEQHLRASIAHEHTQSDEFESDEFEVELASTAARLLFALQIFHSLKGRL